MKDFFKNVLATVVGIFVFCMVSGLFFLVGLVGIIASSGGSKQRVSENSVLVVNLSGVIEEQAKENVLGPLTGDVYNNLGLDNILSAIDKARENDKIKGIYLECGALSAGYATLQEIRDALLKFKKSGKWIVAYSDTYTQGCYYLASAANEVLMNPYGMLDWHGIVSQPIFLKDLYAKFGVKYQILKVGTFKSATEQFTEDRMSDANRLQVTQYIEGLWSNICQSVSASRKISTDSLNAYADRMVMFEPAQNLKKYGLVDNLVYVDNVKNRIKKRLKISMSDRINTLSVEDMKQVPAKKQNHQGDIIALYYAYGNIVQNSISGNFSQNHEIASTKVCQDLADLMDDDDVKAVVLRINSGGGDAMASEFIWHQVKLLNQKKPVIVSMGDYAASGGYYISSAASWIVAQPNTLTGSIGIFAAIPDFSGLVTQKLGVKFDEVKTNRNSGFGNVFARPLNSEEKAYLQGYINRGYDLFLSRVAEGRGMSKEEVDKIGQGRVWLGKAACDLALVDELGGINVAVAAAAKYAKLKDYHVLSYPAPSNFLSNLFADMMRRGTLDEQLKTTLGDFYVPFMHLKNMNQREVLQAQMPFVLNIN